MSLLMARNGYVKEVSIDPVVLDYLRQIRGKERAFDPRDVRARVLEAARVRVPYTSVTIDFEDGAFTYRT